ncbi:unnamed protein product [Cylindrotheca closterium]|uniref:Uncharacterized protein n=1 Tax=Cylindrotheca closterium TaxID=2856 RepID=A0AAD2CXN5_9STRA|nr:unnamed protein product [Cylindrotheca closterium]
MSTATRTKVAGNRDLDDEAVASLLRAVKTIAAKEVEVVDPVAKLNLLDRSPQRRHCAPTSPMLRGRSISFATEELTRDPSARASASSPLLSPSSISPVRPQPRAVVPDLIEHHDWSKRVGSYKESLQQTIKKRKDGSFVGQIPRAKVRATLRRKFSWKLYPELEHYLLQKKRAYFEFSSRNYTPEQRRFNNTLTRELLDLASSQGFAFESFTFAMVRDRIRCYYKSYSQSMKKKMRK